MARKKTVKRKTKQSKAPRTTSSSAQKMEKDFLATPSKVAAEFNKEIKGHKQKETKLKADILKSKSKMKAAESKLKLASGKKQLGLLKNQHKKMIKTHMALEKQLKETTQKVMDSFNRIAKLTALRKHLAQFQKEWNSQTKKTPLKAKTNSNKRPKKSKPSQLEREDELKQTQETSEIKNDLFHIDEPMESTS